MCSLELPGVLIARVGVQDMLDCSCHSRTAMICGRSLQASGRGAGKGKGYVIARHALDRF
jgi:hypothetical protein